MEQQLTHWKKLHNPNYLGAYSLMETGKTVDMVVTIESIVRDEVKGEDGKKDQCTIAKLYGQKPFILNATNQKMLEKLFKSPYIQDWYNKPFTLYAAKIRVAGETIDALRIRPQLPVIAQPEPPKQKEVMHDEHPKWEGAIKALKDKKTTIEDIRKVYILSPENEQKLKDASTTV